MRGSNEFSNGCIVWSTASRSADISRTTQLKLLKYCMTCLRASQITLVVLDDSHKMFHSSVYSHIAIRNGQMTALPFRVLTVMKNISMQIRSPGAITKSLLITDRVVGRVVFPLIHPMQGPWILRIMRTSREVYGQPWIDPVSKRMPSTASLRWFKILWILSTALARRFCSAE